MIRVAKKRTVLNALTLGLSFLCISELRAQAPAATPPKKPTVNEAQAFVDDAEKQLFDLEIKAQRAAWVEENFINFFWKFRPFSLHQPIQPCRKNSPQLKLRSKETTAKARGAPTVHKQNASTLLRSAN